MWCALRIFIFILTDNVPMKRINIFINFNSGPMRQGDHFSQTKKKSEKPVIDIIDFK